MGRFMRCALVFLVCGVPSGQSATTGPAAFNPPAEGSVAPVFSLPPGFQLDVISDDVPGARSMAWGEEGTLFVGTWQGGRVYALRNALAAVGPERLVIAEGLKMPNGVAFRDGDLFIAEPQRILVLRGIETALDDPPVPVVAVAELPFKTGLHAWKYIAFGPDGRLYVPLGAPCNACDAPGFARILSMAPDGSARRVEALGVRNTVGLAWHPDTGELWFTDNGRDLLGDDVPPCELNRVSAAGQDFGFPYCHGGTIADPKLGNLGRCADSVAPVQALAPHSSPLGLTFYTGTMFPEAYRGNVFIAEHGSWNRSKEAGKTGYRVSLVRLDGNRAVGYEPFLEGFLDGDEVLGRPVDVLVAPDGSLLVSDDDRGAIYRISYTAASQAR
jgi:glucose/arabinose dehydrogenase